MSYYVERDPDGGMIRYTVYQAKTNTPGTRRVVGCASTLWGAKRTIKRHRKAAAKAGADGAVYRELEFADLPDLRVSDFAPRPWRSA